MHSKPITDGKLAMALYTQSFMEGTPPRAMMDQSWPKSYQMTKMKWIRVAKLARKRLKGTL